MDCSADSSQIAKNQSSQVRPCLIMRPMGGTILLARVPTASREARALPEENAAATLAVSVVRRVLQLRPVLAAQRPRVHRRQAQHRPELPADQAQ